MKKEVVGKKGKKKIVIKNKKKLIRSGSILGIILIVIFVIAICSRGVKINSNTNVLELSISKYSDEIKKYYDGAMDKFVEDHNNLQNIVWTYIYNNLSADNTMESLIKNVNEILASQDWSTLGIQRNQTWRGKFYINETSNVLTFKFENKEIEPVWTKDENVGYIIELN